MEELEITIESLELDGGAPLPSVEQRLTVYGKPNAARDNIVLVPHALTGSRHVIEWWPGIVGAGALFDPARWCIIGIDIFDSPGRRVGVRDIVRAQRRALFHFGFERFRFVVSGSLGGMQALQWAIDEPNRVEHALVIAAHDHHSAMGIALNAIGRDCVALDPVRGLGIARKLAMLSYKSEELLNRRHGRNLDANEPERFDIEGYLEHQATKFIARMDTSTYVMRTHAMDSFDVRNALLAPQTDVTFVGISSDWLFRTDDIQAAAARLGAGYLVLDSIHGHDAFLAEPDKLRALLEPLVPQPTIP